MKSSSKNEVRRCRPLLGTLVEIFAGGPATMNLLSAVDAAFGAIADIQRRLSVHDDASELSRANAEAFDGPVKVSALSYQVLECAMGVARDSAGAFDLTVAPVLATWGYRPASLRRRHGASWRDVQLLPGYRVQFTRPLAIDLGGIAKGFAVDRAVEALRKRGIPFGSVNAGGDLRVFGSDNTRVHLRHPVTGQPMNKPLLLCETALATSSPQFTRRRWRGREVSHLVNPLTQCAVSRPVSVSVRAAECWVADALTKVVLNADESTASRLLEAHQAEALLIS